MEQSSSLKLLRGLARRLEGQALAQQSARASVEGERIAIELGREAAALRWALLRLDPPTEGPRQFFEALRGPSAPR